MLALVGLLAPLPAAAQDSEAPETEVPADGTEDQAPESDIEAPIDSTDTSEAPVTTAGVLVPGAPTTEVDADAGAELEGDGISVTSEQSSDGIKPSSVVTLIIVALLVVGFALALLTLAYWFRTRPSRAGARDAKKRRRSKAEAALAARPKRNATVPDGSTSNGTSERVGIGASATAAAGGAVVATRPAAADPTVAVPVVAADGNPNSTGSASTGSASTGSASTGSASTGSVPISRSRPKRSEKADREALVQRVRDDSPGSKSTERGQRPSTPTSTPQPKSETAAGKAKTTDSGRSETDGAKPKESKPPASKDAKVDDAAKPAGSVGSAPPKKNPAAKNTPAAMGPEDPMVELRLED